MARSKLLILSPPVLHAGSIPWYLAGGVAKANCIAAYQAIGAADLATSFINLVTPGTYNLTGGSNPTWSAGTGWTFNGTTQYKLTGINPAGNATQGWSLIVRYSGVTADTGLMCGSTNGSGAYFAVTPHRSSGSRKYYNGSQVTGGTGLEYGVLAVAGPTGYYNGSSDGTITWAACDLPGFYIGGVNQGDSLYLPYAGNIQAVAFYNTVLTAAQVLRISNELEQLPNRYDAGNPAYPSPSMAETGEFEIVWFSDAHIGSWVEQGEIGPMMAWLSKNKTRRNIQAVLYGGDYEDSISHSDDRAIFTTAMANLASIPHLLAIGNHDYDKNDGPRNSDVFNGIFGQSYYTGKSWWSGGFCESGRSENAYFLLTIGAVNYIFITLEWFPREAVIDWADALLTTYAARKAIIITHAYEYTDGNAYTSGDSYGPDSETDITDADYHWGDEMWTELLNIHDNVILIHSGHVNTAAKHVTNSAGGQPVNQVLANFQGGSGVENTAMRFMRFNPTTETIYVETFSPITLGKVTDGSNQFTITY